MPEYGRALTTCSLIDAAVRAAWQCKFKPAIQDGHPVSMWVTYKVPFVAGTSKNKGYRDVPFQIECSVDTVLMPWQQEFRSSVKPSTDTKFKGSPKSATKVDSITPAMSQNFGILVLEETDDTRQGKQRAVALIDGGCAEGLAIGMTGTIWDYLGDDSVKLANVEVMDVQAYESSCLIESLRRKVVSIHQRVLFSEPSPDSPWLLLIAEQHFADGSFEKALACYEALAGRADASEFVSSRLEECRRAYQLQPIRDTISTSRYPERLVPAWLSVARSYLRLDNPAGTQRYVDKILSLDSTCELALELREALKAIADCNVDLQQLMTGIGDTAVSTRLPRMITADIPWLRMPPDEYYMDVSLSRKPDIVQIRALVGSKGQVLMAAVLHSSRVPELDAAALQSAFNCRFEPGISCGRYLTMWVTWKVQFARNRI